MPWPAENSSRVSSSGRTHSGMRRGADVHSKPPTAGESPPSIYMGSKETSLCILRRMSYVVGRGSNQSNVVVASRAAASSPTGMDEPLYIDGFKDPTHMFWLIYFKLMPVSLDGLLVNRVPQSLLIR